MLTAIQPEVWLPAVSATVGALVGASASLVGILLKGRQDRSREAEIREAEIRQQEIRQAAAALGQALSLLYDLGSQGDQGDDEQIAEAEARWRIVREQLLVLVVSYPSREMAAGVLSLLPSFRQMVSLVSAASWESVRELRSSLAVEFEDLLNEVRKDQGLDPLPSE